MSATTLRPELREGHNRSILKHKSSLKALFQEVQRGHEAEIEIMRVLLRSLGVFDEAKEDTAPGAGSTGIIKGLTAADLMNIGHEIPEYPSDSDTFSIATTHISKLPTIPYNKENSTSSRKLSERNAKISVSSETKIPISFSKQNAASKTVPLTSRKSRIERQGTPFRLGKEQKKVSDGLSIKHGIQLFRKHTPGLRTGFRPTNSFIEEKKEIGEEVARIIINSKKNNGNIPLGRVSSGPYGEPSYFTMDSLSVRESLSERKEALSPKSVRRETASDDSDSVVVKLNKSLSKSRLISTSPHNRNKNSLPSNASTLANVKIEDITQVAGDKFRSENRHSKHLKSISSDNV